MAVIDRAAAHQGWPLRGVPLYTILIMMKRLPASLYNNNMVAIL